VLKLVAAAAISLLVVWYFYGPFPDRLGAASALASLAIALVCTCYRDAAHTPEFRLTILLYIVAHAAILLLIDPDKLPSSDGPRMGLLGLIFMADFFFMAWLFPKLTGFDFADEE
jgi:hypothetical protein